MSESERGRPDDAPAWWAAPQEERTPSGATRATGPVERPTTALPEDQPYGRQTYGSPPPGGYPPPYAAPPPGGPGQPEPMQMGAFGQPDAPAHIGGPPRGPDYLPGTPPPYGPPGGPAAAVPSAPRRRGAGVALAVLGAGLLGGLVGGAGGAALEHQQQPASLTAPTATGPLLPTGSPVPPDRPAGSVPRIAAALLPSVVTINVEGSGEQGTGSGVIIRPDGYILTNNHVVAPAANGGNLSVTFYKKTDKVPADIVGRDPKTDLAVVKINATKLPAAALGRSSGLVVGDPVIAVGAPLGLSSTVTSGIVSALDRDVEVPDANGQPGGGLIIGAIQTDAAINPGNSGGALVNDRAQVVGINSAIATAPNGGGNGSIGVGFAIPIDYARSIAEEIIRTGKATHPYLGVTAGTLSPEDAKTTGSTPGALVRSLVSSGPADRAQLKAGDVITKVDDRTVTSVDDLVAATRLHKIGDVVQVTYSRGGSSRTVPVTLQESKG